MDFKLDKEKIGLTQHIVSRDESAVWEAEVTLPASYAAVEKVLYSVGRIHDIDVKRSEGRLDAAIRLEIETIFLGENAVPLNFRWSGDDEEDLTYHYRPDIDKDNDDDIDITATIDNISVTIRGDGRIKVKATLHIHTHVYRNQSLDAVVDVAPQANTHLTAVKEPVESDERIQPVHLKHRWEYDLLLPQHLPMITDVLTYEAIVNTSNLIPLDGRFSLQGNINLGMIYRSNEKDEDNHDILYHSWTQEEGTAITFDAMLNWGDAKPSMNFYGCISVEGVVFIPSDHGVRVRISLSIDGSLWQKRDMQVCREILGGGNHYIDLDRVSGHYTQSLGRISETTTVENAVQLGERVSRPEKVLDIRVRPINIQTQLEFGQVTVRGQLQVTMFYLAGHDDETTLAAYEWPADDFEWMTMSDLAGVTAEDHADCCVRVLSVEMQEAEEGRYNIQVKIAVDCNMWQDKTLMCLRDAALIAPEESTEQRPTFLYYIVQNGDTLWTIARRYHTTMDAIVQANHLEDVELIKSGQKLFIPPFPAAV